jgi:hypothetical protein
LVLTENHEWATGNERPGRKAEAYVVLQYGRSVAEGIGVSISGGFVMRQLMFITIMGAILSPLAMFQSDDPFRRAGKMPASLEKVEAVQVVTEQANRFYSRLETTFAQRVNELADPYFGD